MAQDAAVEDLPVGSFNVLSRMGERVARLEATQEGLKTDTENIRGSVHAINGEMQKVVIVQERISSALTGVTAELSKIVAAAPAIERAVLAFEGMRSDLRTLIEDHYRKDGERGNLRTVLAFAKGMLPWLVAFGATVVWSWEHLRFHA